MPWKSQEETYCPLPATLIFMAMGEWDRRRGTLEGSWFNWGLPLPSGPLPMEAIEKMASLCMRDLDEDEEEGTDEEDVEADDDLLVSTRGGGGRPPPRCCPPSRPSRLAPAVCPCRAELNEVLGEEQKGFRVPPVTAGPGTPDNTGLCSPGFKGYLLPLQPRNSHRWWGASDPQFSTLGDG